LVLSIVGDFRSFSEFLSDHWKRFSALPASHDIVVVAINNEDWARIFRGSPLDDQKLGELVNDILDGGAKAIGVDIDTSDPKFQSLGRDFSGQPVVWGATVEPLGDGFSVLPALGGRGNQNMGVAILPRDGDGVVRGYEREVPLAQGGYAPTLGYATVCVYNSGVGSQCSTGDTGARLLRFSRGLYWSREFRSRCSFQTYSAGAILKAAKNRGWEKSGIFNGKIVLVGGFYDDHERYRTPVGRMWGVEAIGQVIETELDNSDGGPLRPTAVFEVTANTILAFLLIGVFSWPIERFRLAIISLTSAVLILAAPLFLSFLCSSHSAANFSSFAFIPFAVLLEEILYELREVGGEVFQAAVRRFFKSREETTGKSATGPTE